MMFNKIKKNKLAAKVKKVEPVEVAPVEDEFSDEDDPAEEEVEEGIEEVEEVEEVVPKKKLPPIPKPTTDQPSPLTKEEVIGLAEGHLARASELLVYSRSVK